VGGCARGGRLQASASEDMHAGKLEVSLLLHAYSGLVGDDYRQGDWQASPRPHLLVTGMRGYTGSLPPSVGSALAVLRCGECVT
jgi:hypothetical protein